jgi:Fur family ferric uptake transcriptional regulator
LLGADGFIGAQALHDTLLSSGTPVGLTTVYRTLSALAEAGRADVVRDSGGERLFRHRPSAEHRHYLLCRGCGLSVVVDSSVVESWAADIAKSSGFADVEHTLEMTGLCADYRTA